MNIELAIEKLSDSHQLVSEAIDRERSEWLPERPPLTIIMLTVGRSIAQNIAEISDEDKRVIFELVDELLLKGNEAVKDSVATGLLEALLGLASDGKFDFSEIAPFLGSEAKRYCIAWDRFTGCKTAGLY